MVMEALEGPLPERWRVPHLVILRLAGMGGIGQTSGMCIGTHLLKYSQGKLSALKPSGIKMAFLCSSWTPEETLLKGH